MGWLKGINLLLLLGYLMLGLWGLNFALAGRRLRRLEARRRIGGPVFAQMPCAVAIEIFNPQRRSPIGWWIEDPCPAGAASWFVVQLGRHETVRFQRDVTWPRRGAYPWSALVARSGYPFGLMERALALTADEQVLVLPRLGKLHRGRLRRFLSYTAPLEDRFRAMPHATPLAQADFHGLRPFRSGDSPRWIHWRTSARRGELMVREYQNSTTDNLIVVLDPCVAAEVPNLDGDPAPWARDPTFLLERAVSLSATICWEWCRQKGDRFMLAVAGPRPILWEGVTGRALALQVLEGLAVQQGVGSANAEALADRLHDLPLPPAPVLVVSTRGSDLAERLSARLHRPVATVSAGDLDNVDFYEPPGTT
jgi:uncharacterized protein (DUF58 family)